MTTTPKYIHTSYATNKDPMVFSAFAQFIRADQKNKHKSDSSKHVALLRTYRAVYRVWARIHHQ